MVKIRKWFKENKYDIVVAMLVVIIGIAIHISAKAEEKYVQDKEDRINNIEERLTKQEQYMHQVQADVDNLYRVVE